MAARAAARPGRARDLGPAEPGLAVAAGAPGRTPVAGVPDLCPEVVLLYKSKRPRAADEHDARVAIPRLSAAERAWLAAAIAADAPDHQWLPLLA